MSKNYTKLHNSENQSHIYVVIYYTRKSIIIIQNQFFIFKYFVEIDSCMQQFHTSCTCSVLIKVTSKSNTMGLVAEVLLLVTVAAIAEAVPFHVR